MTAPGNLLLIPTFLGPGNRDDISPNHLKLIYSIDEFIVESEKQARAFLKAVDHPVSQSGFVFHLLNEHSDPEEDLEPFFERCMQGKNLGLLSDTGIPCVADPGNRAVAFAHRHGIRVKPLPGPSSIYMSLMASGFNGQEFTFAGYLPVEENKRKSAIRQMEKKLSETGRTQIFIETPYRNSRLIKDLLRCLRPETWLCVAMNIGNDHEWIVSKPVSGWKEFPFPDRKDPAIFLIGHTA